MLSQFKYSLASIHWLLQFLIAALYVLSGFVTYKYLLSQNIICIVWLGSGLALAALLLGGWRYLWGIAIGTFVLNYFTIDSHLGSIGVSLASIFEVILAFGLLSKKVFASPSILPNYLKLIALGGGLASIFGSVIGVSTLLLIGIATPENYLSDVLRWWMGDTLGVMLVTPFVLIWFKEKFTNITLKQWFEGVFIIGVYIVVGQIIFLDLFHDFLGNAPKGYFLFFGMTVIAIRLGMRGVTLIMLFTAIAGLLSAYLKIGYFATDLAESELRNCWLYLFVLSLSGVALASYVDKTKRTLAQLRVEISERERAELLQQKSAQLFQQAKKELENILAAATEISIIATDKDGLITIFNRGAELMLGYQSDEIIGKYTPALIHDEQEVQRRSEELSLKFGKPISGFHVFVENANFIGRETREWTYIRKDKSTLTVSLTVTTILNDVGEITGYLGIADDITERKLVQDALKASEERLNLSQEYGEIGSWEADLINNKQIWSSALFKLMDLPPIENPTWKDFIEFVHPDDRQSIINATQAHILKNEKYDVEYRIVKTNGKIHWMNSAGRAEFSPDGTPIRFIGIAQDITHRKQIELELQRSNADLEQFAYAVSHDMRQPLRMVASYLALLERALDKQLDEEQLQFLQFALDGAKRMDSMILSLLEYSRVQRQNIHNEHVSSRDCVNEALAFLAPALKESSGKVEILGDWVELVANHDGLTRLLQNLIGNALKYHDENQAPLVQVRAIVNENVFRVEVQDFGIGIDPDQINRLFKVFSRLQMRSRFEGSGVGLALCRKIVEQHGGTIGVESEGEGFGCTFWFELPITKPIETVAQ